MTGAPASAGLVQVGLDRRNAGLPELERAHRLAEGRIPPAGVALVTCHRVELYVEEATPLGALQRFDRWLGGDTPLPVIRSGEEAARHLMRVAAGLESALLGDDQILGQARAAYRDACEAGRAGRLLHKLFHAAFRAGRRARGETELKEGARSLGGAAVAAVARRLGGLGGRTVAVLGAGQMAGLAVRHLAERGTGRLVVASRTLARARALAVAHGGEAVPWEWHESAVLGADAVVAAVSAPEPVLPAGLLLRRSGAGPFVVADLGMPRNAVRPEPCPARLELLDVEALGRERAGREALRAGAVGAAERIVEEELARWAAFAAGPSPSVAGRCGKLVVGGSGDAPRLLEGRTCIP